MCYWRQNSLDKLRSLIKILVVLCCVCIWVAQFLRQKSVTLSSWIGVRPLNRLEAFKTDVPSPPCHHRFLLYTYMISFFFFSNSNFSFAPVMTLGLDNLWKKFQDFSTSGSFISESSEIPAIQPYIGLYRITVEIFDNMGVRDPEVGKLKKK